MTRAAITLAFALIPASMSAAMSIASGADEVVSIAVIKHSTVASGITRTIQGVVTHTSDPLFVQDASGAIEVEPISASLSLRIGDEVQVKGTAMVGVSGTTLSHATVLLVGPSVPYPPLAITPSMAASGRYQSRFILTDGVLLAVAYEHHRPELLLSRGHQRFVAELPSSAHADVLSHLEKGSVMRVRGVCQMAREVSGRGTFALVPFRVLMRAQDDMEQIAAPPFWTRTHILVLCAMLLFSAYLGHMFYLRLERWRFQLILRERARVAHDLHDTLAQSFAGINFQLQALRKASAPQPIQMHSYLDLAISMVSHSHEDARRAIAMLRPAEFDTGSLIENLRLQGEQLTHGGTLSFRVLTDGDPIVLSRQTEDLLLRIGHEAVTNGISHAQANEITIHLRFQKARVDLVVSDDGIGIAPSLSLDRDGLPMNGYGIAGMRARARAAGGSLRLTSKPGQGTIVHASVPVSNSVLRMESSILWRLRAWWLSV